LFFGAATAPVLFYSAARAFAEQHLECNHVIPNTCRFKTLKEQGVAPNEPAHGW
jgi:hypothetical protein